MVWSFSWAVAGEFNRGWSRRKEVKAEQTQEETSNIELGCGSADSMFNVGCWMFPIN
jgi:hypothetical protein